MTDLELLFPDEFKPADDWSSHRPMLWMALEKVQQGTFLELGSGKGSTPLLRDYCEKQKRLFVSIDNDQDWADEMMKHFSLDAINYIPICIPQWSDIYELEICPYRDVTIVFIDCKPGEERKKLIEYYRDKIQVIIVHDTEPGAEYVYGLNEVLRSFKYRCNLKIAGMPQTTAVSNEYTFESWKGVNIFDYQFI